MRATRRPSLQLADFAAEDIRPRCYAVGQVFAWLLDGFAPDWRMRLEAGASDALDALLTLALAQYPARPMASAETMQEAAVAQAQAEIVALVTARQERRAAFLAARGWRVVIQARREQPLWPQGFDPLHVRRLTATDILHTRWLKVGHATATIEVLDREALTAGTLAHPLFAGIDMLTLTGLPVAPTIQTTTEGVALRAPGLTATFQHPTIECRLEEQLLLIHC
ncbi:MAG TPA: hypothetical protein VFU78_20875 [Thermomicrobiales bacterium]|nr:hypothetical protein [Thermomicrobiales bacterium]